MKTFISAISGKELPETERVSLQTVSQPLLDIMRAHKQDLQPQDCISRSELDTFKSKYIADYLMKETGDLGEMERTVLESVDRKGLLATDPDDDDKDEPESIGDRIADKVANFGGSWTFIISFILILIVWISGNVWLLGKKAFDPYPFILLNLLLSCIAALQAPVIMMSQNRQEDKDRKRAKKDYMTNLKSELEIRMLHEKLDHLTQRQQEDVIRMQREQNELLNALMELLKKQ